MAKKNFIPAISIVIPLYNAEKYLGECLESILAQTFQNFEVIIADDCSTDKSCEIVESFMKKFDGRLRLVRRGENSGHPGIPTNLGIKISRGEYLFIMDNDDALTKTALEELYRAAKDFQADVVQCEKFFQIAAEENYRTTEKVMLVEYQKQNAVTQPTLLTENFRDRLHRLRQKHFLWNLWSKLIRRDFFLENELELINSAGQDLVCTCCLVCSAKKFLLVPNTFYYYRLVEDSASHKVETIQSHTNNWITFLREGFRYFDGFLSRQKFFQENPDAKYFALDIIFRETAIYIKPLYRQIPPYELDKILREEFSGNDSALTSFLFNSLNFC